MPMSLRCWYAGEEARERTNWTRGGIKGLAVSCAVCSARVSTTRGEREREKGHTGPGEHDTVVCVGCTVLQSLGGGVLFLIDNVVGVDLEAGAAGYGGVGVCGEGVGEPLCVYGMVCGVSGGRERGTYSCRTL